MVDKNLNPHVLEVNLSPSLSADSKMDFSIKSELVKDIFNLVGIQKPQGRSISPTPYTRSKQLKPIGKLKNLKIPSGKKSCDTIQMKLEKTIKWSSKQNDNWLMNKIGSQLSEKI